MGDVPFGSDVLILLPLEKSSRANSGLPKKRKMPDWLQNKPLTDVLNVYKHILHTMLVKTSVHVYRLFFKLFSPVTVMSTSLTSKTRTRTTKSNTPNAPTIDVWDGIKISELSKLTNRPVSSIVRSVNSGLIGSLRVSASTAIENRDLLIGLVSLLGYRPNFISRRSPTVKKGFSAEEFDVHPRPPADPSVCIPRPPVVAIMGHVDHGKTTLLDALRASRIVDEEFGGITQHISAFSLSIAEAVVAAAGSDDVGVVKIDSNKSDFGVITFLDTPGHSAFSSMRARGAKATDIVLLVVAADDGVMPQTVESIKFAKEYGAQLVVAINKIDTYAADVNRAIRDLASHGVLVEQLGGEIQAVEISALRRINLIALLEAIIAQAEVMQLSADPSGPAEAIVLECRTEHGLGKVVNCLVTRGVLKQGVESGPLVAGESVGCTRVLRNDRGIRISSVLPGYTASIAGWKSFPPVGSTILEVSSDAEAEAAVRTRRRRRLDQKSLADKAASDQRIAQYRLACEAYIKGREKIDPEASRRFALEFKKNRVSQLLNPNDTNNVLTQPLIIKADVEGSLEAISDMLATCPSDQCQVQIAFSGVGPVTPTEVELALAIGAELFAFNTNALPEAESALNAHNIFLHSHNVIYRLGEDVRSLVVNKLPPVYVEEIVGEGVVLRTFEVTIVRGKRQKVMVGGCRCTRGNILSGKSSKHGTEPVLFRVLRPTTRTNDWSASTKDHKRQKEHQRTTKPQTGSSGPAMESQGNTEGRVLIDRAPCFSLRHERNAVDSVRKDVEFGIILLSNSDASNQAQSLAELYHHPPSGSSENSAIFDEWAPDDVVQCFRIVQKPQTLQWHIDHLPDTAEEDG